MKYRPTLLLVIATLALITSQTRADVTVTFGTIEAGNIFVDLLPNTAGQSVQFFAAGLAAEGGANGMQFNLQVGDGGAALGGSDTGPVIESIDLITGTIWGSASPFQNDSETNPLAWSSTVDTGSLVTADGLMGTVVFDTTGFSGITTDLKLNGVAGTFDTTFFNGATQLATNAPDGFLRVLAVPEPSSMMVLGMGLLGWTARRRRKAVV